MGVFSAPDRGPVANRAVEFREALAAGVLCADGAMGTQLTSRNPAARNPMAQRGVGACPGGLNLGGLSFGEPNLDELNLSLPALVRDVHQGYLRAGAQILGANTFGANRARLRRFGLGDSVRAVNRAGVRIAREAARGFAAQSDEDGEAFVGGVMGPLGVTLAPVGSTSIEEARAMFAEQAAALVESGVDLLMLETFQDLEELRAALMAARTAGGGEVAIVAQVSTDGVGGRICGVPAAEFVREIEDLADAIGVNCSSGPAAVLEALEAIGKYTAKPLSALPNAGLPRSVDGRLEYPCSPEYLAEYARRFVAAGARIVGGCCGTTPEHIRQMRAAVAEIEAPAREVEVVDAVPEAAAALDPIALAERSHLGAKLAAGHFVMAMEIQAPAGADAAAELAAARRAKDGGADCALVPDAGRNLRMPGAALCQAIRQQADLECILVAPPFDAESPGGIAALQGYLLGAHALGVRNVVLAGSSPGVVEAAVRLNRGLSVTGQPMGSPTSFVIGVTVNAAADDEAADVEAAIARIEKQIAAGADFALTEPLFEAGRLEAFVQQLQVRLERRFPVIASVRALASERDAEFVSNEWLAVVPAETVERLSAAEGGDAARREGIEIAREVVERVREIAAGVALSGPIESCRAAL